MQIPKPSGIRCQTQPVAGSIDDGYTAAQAAKIMGISERRVRQLAADGRLKIIDTKPLLVSQLDAIKYRKKQQASSQEPPSSGITPETLQEMVTAVVTAMMPLMLEQQQRTEEALKTELAALRAENTQLRAAAATPSPRPKWWGRKAKPGDTPDAT
jgi:hypothetical protein